jgi:hypothetical protein
MASQESLSDQLIKYAVKKDRIENQLKTKNLGIVTNSFQCADRIISDAISQAQSVIAEINYATDNAIESVTSKQKEKD